MWYLVWLSLVFSICFYLPTQPMKAGLSISCTKGLKLKYV